MKRGLIFTLLIILSIFMVSCNDITKKVATEDELLSVVSNIQELKNCFKSDFVYDSEYYCKDIKIIKRQINKEEKEDLVFIYVTMENEYFTVSVDVDLNFGYYETGGWILDKYNWNVVEATPIRAPEYSLVKRKVLYEEDDMGNTQLKNLQVYFPAHSKTYNVSSEDYRVANIAIEEADTHIQLLEKSSNYPYYQAQADLIMGFRYFDATAQIDLVFNPEGWELPSETFMLSDIRNVEDMSKLVGRYKYERSKSLSNGATFLVFGVDVSAGTIECEYDYWRETHSMGSGFKTISCDDYTKTVRINPFNLSINITEFGHKNGSLIYIPSENCWRDYFNGDHYRVGMWGEEYDDLLKISNNPFGTNN